MAGVKVFGDYDDIQSSVDFFLSITSKSSIESDDAMREKFFKMFRDEEEQRESGLIDCDRLEDVNDYKIKYIEELKLMGNEEVFSQETNYWGSSKPVVEEKANDFLSSLGNVKSQATLVEEEVAEEDNVDGFLNSLYMEEPEDDVVETEDSEVYEEQEIWSSWGSSEDDEEQDGEVEEQSEELEAEKPFDFQEDLFSEEAPVIETNKIESIEEIKKVNIEQSDVTNVPLDLRDYVRAHPGCEVSDALKYFGKKEIDRQLSLGRVFKRKNKLLI